jgi:hypothetical protein
MEWTDEVGRADWIRERLDSGFTTMHGVVPRGYPAYIRIFHPASRDRPVGRPWPPTPADRHRREWDAFQDARPEIETERVAWAAVAEAFGTTMHAQAQWFRLLGVTMLDHPETEPRDAAGWRYSDPSTGRLDADILALAAEHLAVHTTTPDEGFVAVWSGWGGLMGAYSSTPARTFLTSTDDDAHARMLQRSIHDPFNGVFSKPAWQPGVLSDEISRGRLLDLPMREHVLFRGGVSELADEDWPTRAPWADPRALEHGFSIESPSLVWPDDRAWVLVTEVDFDSTIVGGEPELIRALHADARLETIPVREGTDLTGDADEVNR